MEAGNCSEGSLRLVDGSDLFGRLEVCINNAWGTICGTQFDSRELKVACSQLGGTGSYRSQIILYINIVVNEPSSPIQLSVFFPVNQELVPFILVI